MRRLSAILTLLLLPALAAAQSTVDGPAVPVAAPPQLVDQLLHTRRFAPEVLGNLQAIPLWGTPDGRVLAIVASADSSVPGDVYPQLAFNAAPVNHVIFMRPVYRRSDARYIYHLQADPRNRYLGTPNIGVVDGQRKIVFMGVPLHLLNNTTQGNPRGLGGADRRGARARSSRAPARVRPLL